MKTPSCVVSALKAQFGKSDKPVKRKPFVWRGWAGGPIFHEQGDYVVVEKHRQLDGSHEFRVTVREDGPRCRHPYDARFGGSHLSHEWCAECGMYRNYYHSEDRWSRWKKPGRA